MGASSTSERIRAATRADAPAVAAIYGPEVAHGTASFETEPPSAGEMADRIGRCIDRGWPWLVLEGEGGQILGYAYLNQFRDRAAYAHTAETSVYVASGARGLGVGRQLMEALIPAGRAAGFRQFVAVIGDSGNHASIALHSAAGFRHVGTLTGVGEKFGQLLDVVYMQRGEAAL
ncbi:N-acetyltransferase family protein [Sandaracinobacter sp.]|uniref:GNAT family N-acetyltransferase n=1 Tax=Sandaracinobacter sp. TaxID=2487581 RepID=UPI0035AF218C